MRKPSIIIGRITLAAVAVMMTVSSQAQEWPNDISLTRNEAALVRQNNDFALNLFRKITLKYGYIGRGGCMVPEGVDLEAPYQSQIVSPLSITYALGMLNNGAAGKTQQEINQVLGFGDAGADAINAFCRKMLTEAPALDEQTKLNLSNAIFFNRQTGLQLKEAFADKARSYYDAEIALRDFDDGQTMDVINQWASDHTEGMIPSILDESTFNPYAVSYLLNAIYFKGTWTLKFDPEETKEEPFYREKSIYTDNVQMMHLKKELGYTENDDFQAIQLPYGNQSFQMTVLLPREGKTVEDLLWELSGNHSMLTADRWEGLRWMSRAVVDVKLPRFETESDINLKPIMSLLGMPTAFDQEKAEFPDMCDMSDAAQRLYIALMKQSAKIKVSEEGTEAAAVTIIGTEVTGMPTEPKHVSFHANRPFLYIISDVGTGTIFFIGQYMGEGTTGIAATERQQTPTADESLYDLQGQRLSNPPTRGIYVRNGKKINAGQ
ncbi:MAG: serpin family protein [Prevotella sp.]|nr:serpin family protein [Prevotella sp.]